MKAILTAGIVFFAVYTFFFARWPLASFFVMAPTENAIFAAENDAQRKALEDQLAVLESQIADYEATVSRYK